MLVDLDYFFAQCEELRNQALKDKPVIVCMYSGRTSDSGAVSTANYIARKYGVKSGMPIYLAKKKTEETDAVFLPVDHEFYEKVSESIMNLLRGFADRFEQVGIEEAYLDVSQRIGGDFEKARELAQELKRKMKTQQGLTCSVGIGPNKLVAKIAADIQKPDGLTVIQPQDVEAFLAPLPVNSLLGVGRKTTEKMQTLGINTVEELRKHDIHLLAKVFGENSANYFHAASIGVDDEPVQEKGEPESIGRIATLKDDTRDLKAILERIDPLCNDIHTRLLQRDLGFQSVSIATVMTDLSVHSRSKTFETPSSDLGLLKRTAKQLFEEFLKESELPLRRVGVKISNFSQPQKSQKQLTTFIQTDEEQHSR